MRSTREADYALMTMAFLARAEPGKLVVRRDIASRLGLSDPFLAKILGKLCHSGLVRSWQGARGGYMLARAPAETSLGDIVEAIDGPVVLTRSLDGRREACERFCLCEATEAVRKVQERVMAVLDTVTLAEMIGPARPPNGMPAGGPSKGASAGALAPGE